jgi:hypothetical protein
MMVHQGAEAQTLGITVLYDVIFLLIFVLITAENAWCGIFS